MSQTKNLKRNATFAIAEVEEVALCLPLRICREWEAAKEPKTQDKFTGQANFKI